MINNYLFILFLWGEGGGIGWVGGGGDAKSFYLFTLALMEIKYITYNREFMAILPRQKLHTFI